MRKSITASLIREFIMIVVSCMLDPLLFYVLPESVSIPMLCEAKHLRWDKAFPLQGPCAVNPLQAVLRCRKVVKSQVVPAKLSGSGVVLCVSIAFLVEPPNHTSFFGGRVLRVVGTPLDLDPPTRVLYGYAGRGAPRCVCRGCVCSRE